jgi:chemotaxis protein methyltransferase CheR
VSAVERKTCELTPAQFVQIGRLLYQLCGITLRAGKESLVRGRLSKRLTDLGLDNFDDYLAYLETDTSERERVTMIDALTTNKTSFFRENQHFDYLRQRILPLLRGSQRPLRFWSAGCSSGEEPYTLAMICHEEFPDVERRDIRILATDISTRILAVARQAVYEQEALGDLPVQMLQRYFTLVRRQPTPAYQVKETVRTLVRLARLNLMAQWPMQGPFEVILCRNVMIYFDKPTQERLVQRFWELLTPGGYLFVGHSESLTVGTHTFRYVQPAVYLKATTTS